MGLLSAIAAVGGLLQFSEAQKARRDQARKLRKQETLARETARLETTTEDTEAAIALGAEGQNTALAERKKRTVAAKPAPVGGTSPVSIGMGFLG